VGDFHQNIIKEIGPKNEKRYIFDLSNGNIEVCMISDIGTHRTNNEDRCLFSKPESYENTARLGILTAVADGMGGAAAGEHASEMAVNLLNDYYLNSEEKNIPEILLDSIQKINSEIFSSGENILLILGWEQQYLFWFSRKHWICCPGRRQPYLFK
jgi:protein phosphatase